MAPQPSGLWWLEGSLRGALAGDGLRGVAGSRWCDGLVEAREMVIGWRKMEALPSKNCAFMVILWDLSWNWMGFSGISWWFSGEWMGFHEIQWDFSWCFHGDSLVNDKCGQPNVINPAFWSGLWRLRLKDDHTDLVRFCLRVIYPSKIWRVSIT